MQSMAAAVKRPGVKASAFLLLYDADAWVMSLLTLRTILDGISRPRRMQTLAVRVGREMETELRIASFERTHARLHYHTLQRIEKSGDNYRRSYREKVWATTAKKHDVPWAAWTEDQRFAAGMFLVDALMRHTGLVEAVTTKVRAQTRIDLAPTKILQDWLDEQHQLCSTMRPRRAPMLCPPLPWVDRKVGGYLTPEMRRPLVRVVLPEYGSEFTAEQMPVVFGGLNFIQATPWRVNTRVLDVALELWDNGLDLPGACRRNDIEIPPRLPDNAPKEEWLGRKVRAREVRSDNQANAGRRINVAGLLGVARLDRGHTIWFPHDMDFRGRMYPQPQYLTPQGSDLAVGLLEFGEAKPLGRRGAWWLAVMVANAAGQDKLDFESRVAWTLEHSDRLVAMAGDPLNDRWWHEVDAPFAFLAAAFEWQGYVEQGEAYPSRMSGGVDGSCNGIQHLAALSRDEEAGKLVNLVPGDRPSDIYRRVADRLQERINSDKADLTYGWMAEAWDAFGIDRSMCKRPTMILPYNGTRKAVIDYTNDHVTERVRLTGSHPFGVARPKCVYYAGLRIWDAMTEVVTGPRQLMEWAGKVAAETNKLKAPLIWRSPSGFLVVQAYREKTTRRVRTRMGDVAYRLTLRSPTEELDRRRQTRAVAPNWIHSLDAAALHATAYRLSKEGLTAMTAVHDKYGTHLADMDQLVFTLRDEFAAMYESADQRERFVQDACSYSGVDISAMPEPPPLGSLDISCVRESPYFFS